MCIHIFNKNITVIFTKLKNNQSDFKESNNKNNKILLAAKIPCFKFKNTYNKATYQFNF